MVEILWSQTFSPLVALFLKKHQFIKSNQSAITKYVSFKHCIVARIFYALFSYNLANYHNMLAYSFEYVTNGEKNGMGEIEITNKSVRIKEQSYEKPNILCCFYIALVTQYSPEF